MSSATRTETTMATARTNPRPSRVALAGAAALLAAGAIVLIVILNIVFI